MLNKDGQEVQVLRFRPTPCDRESNSKKLTLKERDPFPARIIVAPPDGIALPSKCDIVAEIFPRRVDTEESDTASELSDLVTSVGET